MRIALRGFVMFVVLFLYAPTLLLPIFAFNDSKIVAFPLSGVTTRWFELLWENEALHSATINSLIIAVSAAILATMLGLLAARSVTRYKYRAQLPMLGFIMLPMVLPEIIIGVSLLVVILQAGFELSLFTIILGHTLICTPFAIALLRTSFQQLDPSMEEASFDLGESRLATFYRVTLPLIMPGVISSLLVSFTISLDEFIIAFFLSGTEPTLPVYIWGQLRFPQKIPSILALGTVLLVLSVGLLSISEIIRSRSARRLGLKDGAGGL
jgi:spermidine/putrescine transport system permease protein